MWTDPGWFYIYQWKFAFDSDPRLHDLQPSCSWASLLCILVFLWITKFITAPPPPPPFRPPETIHHCFHFAAYREREAASRRKKKVDGKEKAGRTGKSQNQSSGNNLDNILQSRDTYLLKKWWIFNFLNYQVLLEDIVLLLVYHQI